MHKKIIILQAPEDADSINKTINTTDDQISSKQLAPSFDEDSQTLSPTSEAETKNASMPSEDDVHDDDDDEQLKEENKSKNTVRMYNLFSTVCVLIYC